MGAIQAKMEAQAVEHPGELAPSTWMDTAKSGGEGFKGRRVRKMDRREKKGKSLKGEGGPIK